MPQLMRTVLAGLLVTACSSMGDAQVSEFGALIEELSEADRYFDTDNLISNESSYLHALGPLRELGLTGGAYIGVGPDQNFSYMAAIRPEVAFVLDIRRDNLLQHLLLKALFELAPTRVEYLCLLTGRRPPDPARPWADSTLVSILAYLDTAAEDSETRSRARFRVDSAIATFGVSIEEDEWETIARFHRTFMDRGLDLRFSSHGRAPQPYYPTYRRLLLERTTAGDTASYLWDPADYAFVRDLQLGDRVIPVVGDLAGDHAVRAIGDRLRRDRLEVAAFYVSNVEFYLFRSSSFGRFAENLLSLPLAPNGAIIRSVFLGSYGFHPAAIRGYASVQLVQRFDSFGEMWRSGSLRGYRALVGRNYEPYPRVSR